MADVKWTAAQQKAINSRGNVLVSAAAGSGKTATLSAKIMKLLEDESTSLSDFLIVTFTNAAALELKERISREITKAAKTDRSMLRHKRDVAGADICTIHSFCLKLVRRYFSSVGISPDSAIADEASADVMKSRTMSAVVDDFLSGAEKICTEGAADVFTLADTIGKTKDAAGLDAELRALQRRLESLGLDEAYLRECARELDRGADGEFFDTAYGTELRNETVSAAVHYSARLSALKREMAESEAVVQKYMPAAESLSRYLERVIGSADSYENMALALSQYDAEPLGALSAKNKTEASEAFKKLRDEIKKLFTKISNRYFSVEVDMIGDTARRTASVLCAAADVLEVYGKRYSALKRERGVLDFSDLEALALKLLENEDGTPSKEALEAGARYKFVFIDEYQDTNGVQDRIFRAVSSSAEKFFVGDIKQSIYRFRGAEPEVFSGYRRAWSEDESDNTVKDGYPLGHSIFMSENFRCAEPVIEFANAVSRYMFPHGAIPFSEADCLVYGGVAEGDVPAEVCLLDGSRAKAGEEDSPKITEAEYVADRVYSLLKNGEAVPSDIAILLRSANASGVLYEEALRARGVPVKRVGGSSFADEAEVLLTLNILKAIDNPMRDVPLASALLSSVFGFTLDELSLIRLSFADCPLYTSIEHYAEGEGELQTKCRDFILKLTALRSAERGMSADRFIEHLYAECSLFECAEVTSKLCGAANLHTLHELARTYEKGIFGGLYGFLAFIDEKLASGTLSSEGNNDAGGVTIVSIHKSKGLEYKICFLCECGKARNDLDERGKVLFDKSLGIGLRLPDPSGLILCGNPIRNAVAIKMRRDAAAEEMRILYVAMTRAKNRLIVTAKCKGTPEDELSRAAEALDYTDTYGVLASDRMIELILRGVLASSKNVCRVTKVPKDYETSEHVLSKEDEGGSRESTPQSVIDAIEARIGAKYAHSHLFGIPSKLALSRLYPTLLDDADDRPVLLETETSSEEDASEERTAAMPKPKFMTGGNDTSPTDKGSATHVFLQFADFTRLRECGVEEELKRLVSEGFLTEKMASLVDKAQIAHFAQDGITERILGARRVLREFRFNLLLPASMLTEDDSLKASLDESGECVTAQGVFDCVFEEADGSLVLLDYKTDYMTAFELQNRSFGRKKLRERHSLQLYYYAEAVKRIFGRAPSEVYLYSLALGEAVSVDTGVK